MTFIQSLDYKKIFVFHATIPNRLTARESSWLEFKESFNWGSKDKYAKTIAAFSNNRGGYIVFGVKNEPKELMGLQNNNFEILDEARITAYLNDVFSPEIKYDKFTIQVSGKRIGILSIHKSENKPIVCIKNDGDLKEADIYYRYTARSERIKYPELKLLLDKVREDERKSWMEHLEKISKVGATNAAILDVLGGEITGRGGSLVIDRKLLPKLKFINEGNFRESGKPVLKLIGDVKPVSIIADKGGKKSIGAYGISITNDPNAPAVRLEERDILEKYPLGYGTLTEALLARYSDFKRNPEYHKLRKSLKKDKRFCLTRYLDPNNPKSTKKDFYSAAIFKEFDKHYTKKR